VKEWWHDYTEGNKNRIRPKIKGMAFHPSGFLLDDDLELFLLSSSLFFSLSAAEVEEMPLLQHRSDQEEWENLFPLSSEADIISQQ